MPPFFRSPTAAYVLLPLAAACWAGNHIVARAIAGLAPPVSLSVVRWCIVALILAVTAHAQIAVDWPKLKANLWVLMLLSIAGAAVFGTLQFVALQYTTALNMGVVGSVAPAFIVGASFLLFGDRMRPVQLLGIAISLSGVLAIVTRLQPDLLVSLSFNVGDLLIIANMMFWAVYCACLRLRPALHPVSFLFVMAVVSGITNLPFAAWEYAAGYRLQPTLPTAGAIFYASFVTTLLAYVSWNRGVDLIGAPRASAFLHTIPIFAGVLATSILGETLRLYHVVGFVLILAGVTLAARSSRAKA